MYPSISVNNVPMSTSTTAPAPSAIPPNPGPTVAPGRTATTGNVIRVSAARWSTGLCDCFSDINSCCLTFWCPCITFGRIAEIADKGSTSCGVSGTLYALICCFTCCSCLYSCFYRSKLRGHYFLSEAPCADCCVHCCCEECALCQEYRELQNLGFDMSIGWHGNMERQNRIAAMVTAPVIGGAMTR